MGERAVEFRGVVKRFAGVTALAGVSLVIPRGEVHAIMGENGAGKSTLGKVLAGIYVPDEGEIYLDGVLQAYRDPRGAGRAGGGGIAMVHQELAFCPDLSVAENLAIGRYPRRMGLFVDKPEMLRRAEQLLGRIGVQMDVRQPMRTLSTAQEQLVQIAAAVGTGADIIVFDEPTSSLSETESQRLFGLIEDLKSRHTTVIYVSHRLPEVFRLSDRISVLRDGKYVGTLARAQATPDKVVQMMIGRSVAEYFPNHLDRPPGKPVLEVHGLSSPGKFENISFTVLAGEIVGLAGLVGAGRSEVAEALFGLDRSAHGTVLMEGTPLLLGSIRDSMQRGIALVPEDRKRQGLVLGMSGRANCSLAMLDRLTRLGFLKQGAENRLAEDYFARLNVKTPSVETAVAGLSGGNQQKVVIAKWLARKPKLLIVDEPTRGVDVGAKAAIHGLIDALAQAGAAVLLISSELPEVLNLSTRVLVMREGKMVGQLQRAQANQESVLRMMTGVGVGAS